jgi:hypothetical protein
MFKNSLSICIPIFLVIISGCTKVINFDVSDTNVRLVVDGSVSNELEAQQVKLLKSSSYFANKPAVVVSNAEVSVTDGTQTWIFVETPSGSGIYLSDPFAAKPGINYTLTIKSEEKTYTAAEKMLKGAVLDSVALVQQFKNIPFENKTDSSYTVSVWGKEVAGEKNYYMWKLKFGLGQNFTDTLKNINFLDDTGIDGVYIPGYPIYNIDNKLVKKGDTVTVLGNTISYNYYNYMRSILLETDWRGDNPWDGPPANIPTNLSNGAVGYFYARFVSKKSAVIK